jgi:hypothetical protein
LLEQALMAARAAIAVAAIVMRECVVVTVGPPVGDGAGMRAGVRTTGAVGKAWAGQGLAGTGVVTGTLSEMREAGAPGSADSLNSVMAALSSRGKSWR